MKTKNQQGVEKILIKLEDIDAAHNIVGMTKREMKAKILNDSLLQLQKKTEEGIVEIIKNRKQGGMFTKNKDAKYGFERALDVVMEDVHSLKQDE